MWIQSALLLLVAGCAAAATPPNIVFIVADDLGFNDISFHGSAQIPTPNIDAIFQAGVSLTSYFAQPVCSPTRASIMSARHVIHTGIYMPFDGGVTAEHLNTSFSLMPRFLKNAANYSAHAVGKWHLGANSVAATPVGRGFLTHTGYWSGAEDYSAHTTGGVYDFQDDLVPRVSANGTFSTHIFANAAIDIINAQAAAGPSAPPLFLYLAFQNVHWPLEAPPEYVARFAHSTGGNAGRGLVCAMAAYLDDAIGNVTAAIRAAGLDDNTIIVFVSDNGGPTHNDESTWSNNFPLRGGKNTLWQGGVRVLGAVKGPGIAAGTTLSLPVHATDWLPSLVSMASGGQDWKQFAPPGEPPYEEGDGVDVWATIATALPPPATPPRDWVLLEAHTDPATMNGIHGNGYMVWLPEAGGVFKYLLLGPKDPSVEDGWWPPDGEDPATTPYSTVCTWQGAGPRTGTASKPNLCTTAPCLYNITADPCEYNDIAGANAGIVAQIAKRIAALHTVAPITGEGCLPKVVNIKASKGGQAQAYQPCDAPPLPPGVQV